MRASAWGMAAMTPVSDRVVGLHAQKHAETGFKGGDLVLFQNGDEFGRGFGAGHDLAVHENAPGGIDPVLAGDEGMNVGGVQKGLALCGALEHFGHDAAFGIGGERHLAVGRKRLDGEHGRHDPLREGDAKARVLRGVDVPERGFEGVGEPVGDAGDDGGGPADAERHVLHDLHVARAHVLDGDVDARHEGPP